MKVAVVGLGYFAQFHLQAWATLDEAELVAIADPSADARAAAAKYGAPGYYNLGALLETHDPDVIDIVAPPTFHADLIKQAAQAGRYLICQKPFCEDQKQAQAAIEAASAAGAVLAVHENFRFQPWYRESKRLLDHGTLGRIYQARFALRPGDGQGDDAYLARQPAFQTMPRFLIRETAVHFIDLFQWLLGPVETVYAEIRRLNPAIMGEDDGLLIMSHSGGARSIIDGNRLADHQATDRRRTMGELLIEGQKGVLRLDGEGRLWLRAFGSDSETEAHFNTPVDHASFGGGCVEALCRHIASAFRAGTNPENLALEYIKVQNIVETAYQSAYEGRRLPVV